MMVPAVGVLVVLLCCAASRSGNASAAKSNASPAKNVIALSNIRNLDFMLLSPFFCFVSLIVEVGLLTALTAIQFRAEPGTHPHEALLNSGLTSADSGLQLVLEIA